MGSRLKQRDKQKSQSLSLVKNFIIYFTEVNFINIKIIFPKIVKKFFVIIAFMDNHFSRK